MRCKVKCIEATNYHFIPMAATLFLTIAFIFSLQAAYSEILPEPDAATDAALTEAVKDNLAAELDLRHKDARSEDGLSVPSSLYFYVPPAGPKTDLGPTLSDVEGPNRASLRPITIKVRDRVVHLHGILARKADLDRLGEAAAETPGITGVFNNLNQANVLPLEDDQQIQRNAEHHLTLTPFGDTTDVVMTVDKGVAYLDGEVESWRGSVAAENAAYAGGAATIVNRLEIRSAALPSSSGRGPSGEELTRGR